MGASAHVIFIRITAPLPPRETWQGNGNLKHTVHIIITSRQLDNASKCGADEREEPLPLVGSHVSVGGCTMKPRTMLGL